MPKKTKLLIRDAFFSAILTSAIILIVAVVFLNLSFLNPLHKALEDFNFLDVYYSQKQSEANEFEDKIVLINIENRSRLEIAQMLDLVKKENPRVIGVDIIFKEPKAEFSDSILKASLNFNKLVSSINYIDEDIHENHLSFGTMPYEGYVNFNFDDDVTVVRDFLGKSTIQGKEEYSFASKIAQLYLGDEWKSLDYDTKLGKSQTIKFKGGLKSFLTLDFDDFLDYERKNVLKDKIVIFGYLGTPTGNRYDIQDKFFTPLNKFPAGKSDPDMFGTIIHANIVSMLVNDDFFYDVSNFSCYLLSFVLIFLTSIFYIWNNKKYKVSGRTRKVAFQTILAILIVIATLWLFEIGIVFWTFPMLVGMFLAGSYFKYYKHLVRYIKTKRKWKTYIK